MAFALVLRRRRVLHCPPRLVRDRALRRAWLRYGTIRHRIGTAAVRVCGGLPGHSIDGLRRLGLSVRLILSACVRRSRLSRLLLAVASAIAAGGRTARAVRRLAACVAWIVAA